MKIISKTNVIHNQINMYNILFFSYIISKHIIYVVMIIKKKKKKKIFFFFLNFFFLKYLKINFEKKKKN